MEAYLVRRIFVILLYFSPGIFIQKGNCALTQEELDSIASTLEVKVKVVDNLEYDGKKHLFHVTLYNPGSKLIQGSNWTIYFYSFFMIESDHLPKDGGAVLESQNIRLDHIQGCLFSLEPVSGFGNISSMETKSLYFYGQNWAVSKTDIPPNWYIASPNLQPRVIKSTTLSNPNFIANFVLPKQWKRYKNDLYNPYTPEERYNRYHVTDLGKPGKYVIPTPESIKMEDSSHVILESTTWRIRAESAFLKEAQYLADKSGLQSEDNAEKDSRAKSISLLKNNTLGNEEYYLDINPTDDNIVIKSNSPTGMFYGVQSLLSIIDGSMDRKLPKTEIRDKPRFEFRGMHVDVARNFHSKESIMRLLDVMAMYKMNKLHFHLTDDEGWRVEISSLPELTTIASKRCHDLKDETCVISQLGSGPDDSTSGSGHYTKAEYIDIVKYAADRHIEVIPEIDMPGHARAAIKAMEARFKRLSEQGQANADEHRLVDPSDSSVYSSIQMFDDNAVNPCIESTYNFISTVIDDLKSMHVSAGQPLKIFHFGGDEVANGAWVDSPECQTLNFNSALTGREKYKLYFVQRVANLTHQKGLNLGGWEDGLMDIDKNPYTRNSLATTDVIADAWDNVWEWGVAKRAYALANAGYKLVLSHATHLYFDHPYEPDPEERGLYWAPRFTDTVKAFGYNAEDLYKNIDVRRSGEPITKAEVCEADNSGCPPLTISGNLIGMQGHMWSETVFTKEHFDYMIFPRILTIAERAWHKAPWESVEDKESRENQTFQDWQLFANTIGYKEMKRLEEMGVNFRLAPPGAKLESNKVTVNTEFPTLTVEYSVNNGLTWQTIPKDYLPDDNFLLRTKSPNGLRTSREIKFTLPTDQLLLNYIADFMEVKFDVVDNLADEGQTFVQTIRLKNGGSKPIRSGTWSIYLYHIRLIEPTHFPYPDGYLIKGSGMRVFHIAGSLYKLLPDPDTYQSILSGKEIVLQFEAKYWLSAKTDVMPNWYVHAEGFESRVIKSTEGESLSFVGPFDTVNKWKRFPADKYSPYTPSARYAINQIVPDLKRPGKHLLPTPYSMTLDESSKVTISRGYWVVLESAEFENEIMYLTDKLHLPKVSKMPPSRYIRFFKDAVSVVEGQASTHEAYKLVVDPITEIVIITANHPAGAFYGVQSLLRLSSEVTDGIELPKVEITDQPRFEYRGMHLDVGRNFHSVEDVKLILNAMAMYKMNKFHFHLTDDEGWRLEIPGLKELTEVGSKRCDDLDEETCTLSQIGSGPSTDSSGSGYYTISQYQDILREAARLHIEVIPEFDMPGHARAAIKSMEKRYNYYKAMGNMSLASEFLLAELDDPSKYLSVQFFTDNAINPCLESTYTFVGHIVRTIKQLHQDIQPLSVYHFGGDEVAGGAWLNSTTCLKLMNETSGLNSVPDLKEYFARRVAEIAEVEGLDIGSWEDGVMKTLTEPFDINKLVTPPRKVFGYSWNNIFEWGSGDHAYVLANAGYKVVLAHATHVYFDHPYEPDPEERGYYWATRFTDTFKTFSFIPGNIYANVHLKVSGEELTPQDICKTTCLQLTKPENIVGIQGALWSETVRTSEQLHNMIFPRLLALAERAWHKSEWEDVQDKEERNNKIKTEWKEFANTIAYNDMKILDNMGIKYRVPPPGAKRTGKVIEVNSIYPGLDIEYSQDNGRTWKSVSGNSFEDYNAIKLRTRSKDKTRSSRIITVPKYLFTQLSSASCFTISYTAIIAAFFFYLKFKL